MRPKPDILYGNGSLIDICKFSSPHLETLFYYFYIQMPKDNIKENWSIRFLIQDIPKDEDKLNEDGRK